MRYQAVPVEVAAGLEELQRRIETQSPPDSVLDRTLNLATWNICGFGDGKRTDRSIYYIAEILSTFDLVSVQELKADLCDPHRVLGLLGAPWDAVYSDAILDAGNNRERICFLFDKRAVSFNGLASVVVEDRTKRGDQWVPDFNWWRPPYMASFSAGNFDFVILAAHIQWNQKSHGSARTAEITSCSSTRCCRGGERARERLPGCKPGGVPSLLAPRL